MAHIKPFKAFFYNKDIVEDLNNVITQPYDEITLKMEEEYRKKSPFNVIRIIKGNFEESGRLFNNWIEKGILIQDTEPCIYAYDRFYSYRGELKVQRGFIALGRLSPYSVNEVRPHEKTFPEPVKMQFKLLKTTNAHFGSIFMLYKDEKFLIESLFEPFKKLAPFIEVKDYYGNIHKVWRINNKKIISEVRVIMKGKYLIIADGHHRYEAALQYAKYKKFEEPFNYRMMTFVNVASEESITILPIYRIIKMAYERDFMIKQLSLFFDLYKKPIEELRKNFYPDGFGVYFGDDFYFAMKIKERGFIESALKVLPFFYRNLNTVILHKFVFPLLNVNNSISYETNLENAIKKAKENKKILFIMKPPNIKEIEYVTENGMLMPKKSTNFYPKLLTGLTINHIQMFHKI